MKYVSKAEFTRMVDKMYKAEQERGVRCTREQVAEALEVWVEHVVDRVVEDPVGYVYGPFGTILRMRYERALAAAIRRKKE